MTILMDDAAPSKVIGRASIVVAGTVYQQGIAFFSGLIVARVIGAAEFGVFNLARNLLDLAVIVTRLGLDMGLQRHFGEGNSAHDAAVLRQVRVLAGIVALLPIVIIALGAGRFLEANVYQYPRFADVLLCLSLALPFITDIGVLGGAYKGVLKLSPSVLAECVLLPSIRLAVIILLFLAGWRLWAVVAGTTLASLAASVFLARRARADFRSSSAVSGESWADALRVVHYSSVLAAGVLVATLAASMDILTLGRFASAQVLGQYALVKMLLVLMGVFGVAFTSGLGGLVAQRYARGDLAGVVRAMSVSARLATLLTLPIFAVFLVWGAQITPLFGSSFTTSQAVVAWLAAGQYVFVIFGPSGWALSMTGKHVLELRILCAGLVISALLCWIAVPAFGQLGAAIATCCSIAIANFVRVLFVRRSLGMFPFSGDIFLITAAGVSLAWGIHLLVAQLPLSALWSTAGGIGVFAVAYAAATWTRFLSDTERAGILRVLRSRLPGLSRNEQ